MGPSWPGERSKKKRLVLYVYNKKQGWRKTKKKNKQLKTDVKKCKKDSPIDLISVELDT